MATVDIYKNDYDCWIDTNGDIVKISMQWYPPTEDINYLDSIYFKLEGIEKYTYTFYYAVLIFSYNDLFPRNPLCYMMLIVNILSSVVFQNFFISDITILI